MVANPAGYRTRILTALLAAGLTVSGASTAAAAANSSADLEVKLSSAPSILTTSVNYTVTITNRGPDQLDTATVVVQVDPRAWSTLGNTACPLDRTTATLTCTFGALPAGASVNLRPFVFYDINEREATLPATANRTASSPADPNGANDSDPTTCWYRFSAFGSTMRCTG